MSATRWPRTGSYLRTRRPAGKPPTPTCLATSNASLRRPKGPRSPSRASSATSRRCNSSFPLTSRLARSRSASAPTGFRRLDVNQFLAEVLDAEEPRWSRSGKQFFNYVAQTAEWVLETQPVIPAARNFGDWGTPRASALSIVVELLNGQLPKVMDELDDGRRVVNQQETLAAQEKAESLQRRFVEWLWSDADRAERLATLLQRHIQRGPSARVRRLAPDAPRFEPGLHSPTSPEGGRLANPPGTCRRPIS